MTNAISKPLASLALSAAVLCAATAHASDLVGWGGQGVIAVAGNDGVGGIERGAPAGDVFFVPATPAPGLGMPSVQAVAPVSPSPGLEPQPNTWSFAGPGLPGSLGLPQVSMVAQVGSPEQRAVLLEGVEPFGTAWLVVGLERIDLPFKGGLIGPSLDVVVPLTATGSGELILPIDWGESVGSGFPFFGQFWVLDAGSPAGFSASETIAVIAP